MAAAVQALFGADVAVAWADPVAPATGLLPEEIASTTRMVEKRRRAFAAGRRAARAAMVRLGLPPCPVPMGSDRAPVWPDGLTGSISHTDTHCLAAVTRIGETRSLGLDLEPDLPLEPDLWPEICTDAEQRWLASQPVAEQGRLARLIFSAKECVYKAQYPLTGEVLGFDAFEIALDPQTGSFTATARQHIPPLAPGDRFQGHILCQDAVIVTGMAIGTVTG